MSRMLQRFVRCQEKRAFRKRAEAQREAARLRYGGDEVRAFKCIFCRRYHLGNSGFQPFTNYAQHQR